MSSNPTIISSTSPLKRIMHAVRMIEKGEYDSLILRELMAESGELGQLARKLDEMALIVLHRDNHLRLLNKVIPVGVSLSAERDFNRLLETVVAEAQAFTNADAGTMYLLEGQELRFVILRNTSLDLKMGGTSGDPIRFKPVQLYSEDGSENLSNVASYAALKKQRVKVADAYTAEGFDFSGTKAFDSQTGYRSKSFLTTPLENKEGQVIGILQLINAKDAATGETVEFKDDEVLEALIMLATAALDGYIREATLRQEIAKLRIEINQPRRTRQVEEITDTEFFRNLQIKAQAIREQNRK
ncbi:MAG TPA: GAF domain-containing protein [Anaerolineales bacterium]|nr:GAF domain-containing protein [Anaerolineales bacterium]